MADYFRALAIAGHEVVLLDTVWGADRSPPWPPHPNLIRRNVKLAIAPLLPSRNWQSFVGATSLVGLYRVMDANSVDFVQRHPHEVRAEKARPRLFFCMQSK